jgi:glycosyltransferase involved in cell wall biosynthesis
MLKKITLIFNACSMIVFNALADQPQEMITDEQQPKKTICLNMIVKDESEVIEKCLGSFKHLIDYWVIVDTGSKDRTQEIIRTFMKDIPGELHERPWVDFSTNRNEALAFAKDKGDYLLLIDADEILVFSDNFTLPNLNEDCYSFTVRSLGAADCKRKGLINNHLDWKWEGMIHEDLVCPQAKSFENLKNVTNICNASTGARSKDSEKFLKDAHILEKALKEDPTNSRYAFYLAQSYLNASKYEQALKNFEIRIKMKSNDIQETYLAMYNMGMTQEKLNDPDSALKTFFKTYEIRPTRAEPLLRCAIIYRKMGNYLLGYLLSKYALTLPYPADDLCIEYLTYDHALLIEFANCALLSGHYQEGLYACTQLLANQNLPSEIRTQVVSNLEFAIPRLSIEKTNPVPLF